MLSPNGREGAPDLSVTERPAPQTQLDPPPGTEPPTRAADPRGELGGRPRQEPRPGQGATGAQGACGAARAERKLLFRAGLPRGALPLLLLEPLISAPALVSTLPFLGGDFTQSDLTPVRIYAAIDGWKSNGNSLQYSCLENPMDEGAW